MLPQPRRQSLWSGPEGPRAGWEKQSPGQHHCTGQREQRNTLEFPLFLLSNLLPMPSIAQTQPEASFPAKKPGKGSWQELIPCDSQQIRGRAGNELEANRQLTNTHGSTQVYCEHLLEITQWASRVYSQ